MNFPEGYVTSEPCHYGMFHVPSQKDFVSFRDEVARTQPDDRGMINPNKKPRPISVPVVDVVV